MAAIAPFDEIGNRHRISKLRDRGVEVWGGERVYIGPDVPLMSILPGAVLMNTVITGQRVGIGARSRVGMSGNATIHDCQIGERVEIGAGFFDGATMLDGVRVRGFAEIREGTLLEEQVELGHNVGLKNTVLTAAVIAGSLINFCDLLMTGGTSRSDHSEIGSGTVHFNFDPRGDKFGSLLGDARGLLLRSKRIFIGGNSGLVAPLHVDFGSVVAAGSTIRKDIGLNQLAYGESHRAESQLFDPETYYDVKRKFVTTAKLVGTMHAFRTWYKLVRVRFASSWQIPLYESADGCLAMHIRHRVKELNKVILNLERSLSKQRPTVNKNPFEDQHKLIIGKREEISSILTGSDGRNYSAPPEPFLESYSHARSGLNHVDAIRNLTPGNAAQASVWICEIAARAVTDMERIFAEDGGRPAC